MHVPDETRDFARHLRRQLTLPEAMLWRALKPGRAIGLQFRKQHPLGPYVLDFYCHRAGLAVEVDGLAHSLVGKAAGDARREAWLAEKGIRTLRVVPRDVLKDADGVARMVFHAARERLTV
jgi:very-short-patch-repair endonuclease